jgi:hypothetical protein
MNSMNNAHFNILSIISVAEKIVRYLKKIFLRAVLGAKGTFIFICLEEFSHIM